MPDVVMEYMKKLFIYVRLVQKGKIPLEKVNP